MTNIEQRTVDVPVRDITTEGRTLRGFACLYGVESRDLGGFTESIAQGAFGDVLAGSPDVYLTFNHSPDKVLARTTSGTLRLRDEERGLGFEADLGEGPTAHDVRDMVRRGDVSGASFRFVVAPDGERWEGERRTLTRIERLIDLSLATTPAYDGPRVELRSRPEHNQNKEDRVQDTTPEQRDGGLSVEDAAATSEPTSIEETIVEFVRGTKRGEARALTTAVGVSQAETSIRLFDKLRAASVFLMTGVPVLATDSDSIVFPQLTADAVPAAYAEGATITPGDPTIGTITAVPRKYAHLVQLSNELVDDSDPSIIEVLRQHLTAVLALKLDLDFFQGSGTPPAITGLSNVANIQTETSVGSFTNIDWVASAIAKLETENVPGPYVMVTHPRTVKRFRTIKTGVASSVEPLLEGPLAGQDIPLSVYGVRVYSSSQLAVNEGAGTNENSAYIYAPSQLHVVRRSDVEFEADRSRLFNSDQSEVRIKTRLDLLAPNPKAIVRASGILA